MDIDISTINSWITLGIDLGMVAGAIVIAKLIQLLIIKLSHSQRLFHGTLAQSIIERSGTPLLWLLICLALYAILPFTHIDTSLIIRLQTVLKPISVAVFGWLVISVTYATGRWLEQHYADRQTRDSLGARRFTTQIHLLMRVVVGILAILTIIGMALVIPSLREFGMSLFASAGVAGIVLGVAAKETLSNIIAGVQLALSQQILLGDEVVVLNQSGTIEEITSSYVVVRTWDLRRLIIPLRYFMENAFENLTYHEANLFGPIFIYADYSLDIPALRTEAERLIKASPLWDGKRCEMMVTNMQEHTLQMRVAVSAGNSADLWKLQCSVREQLVSYLQHHQPHALPKTRIELQQPLAALASEGY